MELNFGWEPDNSSSAKRYELWKLATHIERLDEKLVVTESNGATVMTIEEMKECHGPWHRHGHGKGPATYDSLPLSSFRFNTKGTNAGKLASLCIECQEKQRDSDRKRKSDKIQQTEALEKRRPIKPLLASEPIVIEPVTVTETGVVYRWRVTVVQPTEHYVQAKDFLDAAAQVAALGEVTKVEKL
jgi:hypothetical protein